MPGRKRYRACKRCRRDESEAGRISSRGLCHACGRERLLTNVEEMVTHSGPGWHRWRAGMAACVGGVLLDEPRRRD